MNEFAICWVKGDTRASITAPSSSWLKNRMLKLREEHPYEVVVHENKDGSIVAYCPVKYVKVSPPRKVSEEQRQNARERFLKMHHGEKEEGWEEDEGDEWEGLD